MLKNTIHEKVEGTVLVKLPNHSIGGKDTYRAITKIATNFYIYKGGKKEFIKEPIAFIKNEIHPFERAYSFYPPDLNIHDIGENEVSHILYLKGDPNQAVLYCYVELFSAHCFLVPLNMYYDGPYIEGIYSFDVLLQEEIEKNINIPLNRQQIIDFTTLNTGRMKKNSGRKVQRVYKIIESNS